MKITKRILALVLCFVMLMATACGGNSGKEKEQEAKDDAAEAVEGEQESEGEEYVTWIREAWDEYKTSDIRGFVDTKFNGSQSEINTFDTGKQQWMLIERYNEEGSEGTDTVTLRIKEGDKDYIYKTQRTGEDTYDNLKVLMDTDETNDLSYSEYMEEESKALFESDDETEISNISAVQEGEEEINGVKAVKIEVSYEKLLKSGEKVTRESVLAERGWTEEELSILSDYRLGELIDAYVESVNSQIENKMTEPSHKNVTYYLSSDGHKLLRSVQIISGSDGTEMPSEVGSLIGQLKSSLENGESEEEALEWIRMYAEGSFDFDYAMESIVSPSSDALEVTRDYQTGDECEPMCEIPADAKEITWEQWMKHEF